MVKEETRLNPALRSEVEAMGARVRRGFPFWLSPFVRSWVSAITLGRTVYLSSQAVEWTEDRMARTMRHELAHVRQVVSMGLVRFLVRYLSEYMRLRRAGLDAEEAYREISFEKEARAAETVDRASDATPPREEPSRQPDDI